MLPTAQSKPAKTRSYVDMNCLRRGERALFAVIALFATAFTGCQTSRVERQLDKASYFSDNDISFQPRRVWRLKVRWEPYLLDHAKAMLVKNFQLIVHGEGDRRRLEAEIK